MTDILERLRMQPKPHETIAVFVFLCREAAVEIERLRGLTPTDAQGASLRQALIEVTKCETALRMGGPAPEDLEGLSIALEKAVEIAANALDAAQPQAAPVETKSASEMIAACYEGLCPDGSSALDFEWARQRGYILPNNGSGKLSPAQCSAGIDGDVRKALTSLSYWCTDERSKIGNVDGYDYRSGEEYGVRKVEVEIERRLAALPADPPQPVKVTDGSDCAYRIAITPRNGAPHGAGYACGLTGGHCLAKAGCGYEPSSSMSRPHGGRDL